MRRRFGEQITLRQIAAEVAQFFELLPAFDPLGNDLDVQVPRHCDDGAHDREIAHVSNEVAHETAVDLEVVDAPSLQVRQARIARSKIVDGQLHAQLTQPRHRVLVRLSGAPFTPLEHRTLGQFQLQHRGLDVVLARELLDRLRQIGALQLNRRDVDRDRHRRAPALAPANQILHDTLQDEVAYRHDETRFLGHGDKALGGHEAMCRVLPPQQRLHSEHVVGLDIDDRLIVNVELVVLHGHAQARLDRHPLLQLAVHRGVEELIVVTPAVLGLIHGRVRVPEQLAHVVAVAREHADANAHRGYQRTAVYDYGVGESFVDAAGGVEHLLRRLHVLEHDDELVTAHSHDHVFRSHGRSNSLGDRLQKLVAGLVPAGVIDVLEAIEVEKQHRQHLTRRTRLLDGTRQVGGEKQPVREPGQLIVVREVIEVLLLLQELSFHLAAQADVVDREAQHTAAPYFQGVPADLDALQGSVLASLLNPGRHARVGITQPDHQLIGRSRLITEQLRQSHEGQLGRRIFETALQRRIRRDDLQRVGVDQQHSAGRLIECRLERVVIQPTALASRGSISEHSQRACERTGQCREPNCDLVHT